MQNKINPALKSRTALKNRNEILSRFSHAQDLDFGGNVWSTQALKDPSKKTDDENAIADAYLSAWNLLWDSITQAGIRSVGEIRDDEISWQVCNWAGDAVIALMNANRWQDCINLNEQISAFGWEGDDVELTDPHSGSMKRNARRDIAECYAELGEAGKSEAKFQEFLLADPFWGWGWIGYLQMLEKYTPEKLNQKCDFTLLQDKADGNNAGQNNTLLHAARLFIEANPVAMDTDMIAQMAEIYQKHGTSEDAAYFVDAYNTARNEPKNRAPKKSVPNLDLSKFESLQDLLASKPSSSFDTGFSASATIPAAASATVRKAIKIGRNDPCPCGSGKKYKKCCGK